MRAEELKNVPENKMNKMVNDFFGDGAIKVSIEKNEDGTYNVIAYFED